MVTKWPGVGVAMAIALWPTGVAAPGVINLGVIAPDREGVWGVIPPGSGVALDAAGVSSQRLRRLEAEGVGVSWIISPPRSVRGVSAHPETNPGVNSPPPRSVFGVSSHRLRFRESSSPGVDSQRRLLPGVMAPPAGVSDPLDREGVSSQWATAGVSASHVEIFFFWTGAINGVVAVAWSSPVWSHLWDFLRGTSFESPFASAVTFNVPSFALSASLRRTFVETNF